MDKKRGILLTIWLVLMFIFSAAGALVNLLQYLQLIPQIFPKIPMWIWFLYEIAVAASAVFTIFIFKWKKWALYALCITAIFEVILNVLIGVSALNAIFGLLGPVILCLLLRPKWSLLK